MAVVWTERWCEVGVSREPSLLENNEYNSEVNIILSK